MKGIFIWGAVGKFSNFAIKPGYIRAYVAQHFIILTQTCRPLGKKKKIFKIVGHHCNSPDNWIFKVVKGQEMAYKPKIGLREEYDDLNSRWSEWLLIMSPVQKYNWKERTEGHPGYRSSTMDEDIPEKCGIYELGLSKYGRNPAVVYIGNSCRGQISARIQEYSLDGSHKADFIDEAIDRGYDIYVRYMLSRSESVKKAEERYLKLYDYAWNERMNGESREYYP